jgi:beta-glucanase (GH16 family)
MIGVSSVTVLIVAAATTITAAAEADAGCIAGLENTPSCSGRAAGQAQGLQSDHVLLHRSIGAVSKHSVGIKGPDSDSLVKDEDGYDGGDDDLDDVVETTPCKEEADVRRRRRASSMCSCRRRDSDKRYDGGWICQGNSMVKEKPQYTRPIWSEEFDDDRGDGSLDESKWVLTHSGSGNGNNEKQFYTTRPENLNISNGVLKIVGKFDGYEWKQYTSGKITTKNKGDWGPGTRIEVRAKLPLGVGTWPAIWMMPTDSNYGTWPDSGEIDIMEAVGRKHGKIFGTIHTGAYNHMKGTHQGKNFYTNFNEWHTYALHWGTDNLTWYADGNLYNTFAPDNVNDYAKWPFNRRFYLILNLALGGTLGGNINILDDQIMEVDYVRVYCLDGSTQCATNKITCCGQCSTGEFCSQKSNNCYSQKKKDYYDEC